MNHLPVMESGLPVNTGITKADITIQIIGPYTAATLSIPNGVSSMRRSHAARGTSRKNTVDHDSATKKCTATPIAVVRAPPPIIVGPKGTDATPCQSCVKVRPYEYVSTTAQVKSTTAVSSHARRSREPGSPPEEVSIRGTCASLDRQAIQSAEAADRLDCSQAPLPANEVRS